MQSHRLRLVHSGYSGDFNATTASSEAADEIIERPDAHLLSQEGLFAAEGGYAALALQMGFAFGGLAAACVVNPRMLTYFKHGQLRAHEWSMLSGATFASYYIGGDIATRATGDYQKVTNHWLAYTFVKEQNRFLGRSMLTKTPSY